MTGSGFDKGILGDWSLCWFALVIVFFLAMVCRRQSEDGFLAGTGYNFMGALILGMGSAITLITITGSARWGLLVGLIGMVIGGFGLGLIIPSESSGEANDSG